MPSGKIDLTQFAGLVTAPGMLERSPASFVEATNFEFPAPGLISKRRGFERLPGNAGGSVWKLLTSRLLGQNLLAHIGGGGVTGTQIRYGDGSVALTALLTIDGDNLTRTADPRMQGAVSRRNHYVTADEGVARIESDIGGSDIRYAGMPRGQGTGRGFSAASLAPGSALADGFARAYRVTWCRKDADGVVMQGAPTTRVVISNRSFVSGYGGAFPARAALEFRLPLEFSTLGTALGTDYFWQLWGTRTFDEAGGQTGDDEMHLVAEAYLTSTDIGNGYVLYADDTPDSFLLGAPLLHTNLYNFPVLEAGIRQGTVNENAPPPVANDVAYWQDCLWYADYAWRRRLSVNMIALIANNSSVTVTTDAGSINVFARNAPALVTDFQRVTTAPSTALNIRETVRCLVGVLNERSAALGLGFSAHHVSTSTTQPGIIYVELTKPGAALSFGSSDILAFSSESGYELFANADDDAATNGVAFSKATRADAVPPINTLVAGPADGRILRAFPFRDRLLLFTDYGIYQVTGSTFADFAVSPFDTGYRLAGRELVALCDEKVYAWCWEGIVEIDDGGVRVVSAPIEPTIEQLILDAGADPSSGTTQNFSVGRSTLTKLGFAVGYRERHQVRFHFPEATDTVVNGCYAWLSFDTRTRTWAMGELEAKVEGFIDNRACGVVRFSDDKLSLGNWSSGADTYLFLERRAYSATDYIDDAPDGDSGPVGSQLSIQWLDPDHSGAQHWQQTIVSWDAEEFSWRTLPTTVSLSWVTESGSAGVAVVAAELFTRSEAPLSTRRSNRLRVGVAHQVAEYCGLVGISQTMNSGTKFGRQVTP